MPRSARSAGNKAWAALGRAESAWADLVSALEILAPLHGDQTALPAARDLAQEMHAFREVLKGWGEE